MKNALSVCTVFANASQNQNKHRIEILIAVVHWRCQDYTRVDGDERGRFKFGKNKFADVHLMDRLK